MGCGAGCNSGGRLLHDDDDGGGGGGIRQKFSKAFGRARGGRRASVNEDPFAGENGVPDGIVLCSAKRPDWGSVDYLVFETKEHAQESAGQASPRSEFNSTGGSSKKTDDDEGIKGGKFFSKRMECIGTWRISGNVLALVWPGKNGADTVLATKTERQWTNAQTKLTIDVLEPKLENPEWFQPDCIAEKFKSASVSSKCFECPVCYFELYLFRAGVIRLHSRRCCGHYFHKDCAHYLLKAMEGSGTSATCPLCGVSFSEVKMIPDVTENPRDWFAVVDVDFGGELDAYEVVEALGCVLPVNRHKLEKNVKAHWHEWDPDGDGTITLAEFIKPGMGLRDWMLGHLGMLKAEAAAKPHTVPSIDRNPREWFHYWDRDSSGTLEKDEVVRALIRTFCRDENGFPFLPAAHDMREISGSLWASLGYSPFESITFPEFVKPFGLLDQFLHNQSHCAFFGLDAELIA